MIVENGTPTGFDVELWGEIARQERAGEVDAALGVRLALAPQPIDEEACGDAFPEGSKLREPVNRELLAPRENGQDERLREKWFGEE